MNPKHQLTKTNQVILLKPKYTWAKELGLDSSIYTIPGIWNPTKGEPNYILQFKLMVTTFTGKQTCELLLILMVLAYSFNWNFQN